MASGFTTLTNEHLIRTDVWSRDLKQLLLDDLFAMKFVRTVTDFQDGQTLHIPSVGEAETADFLEGKAIKYNKLDTGDFEFEIDQYPYSAHAMSAKFKRDSYYAADVLAMFVPRQHRALMERVEARILSRGPAGQTASNFNLIHGLPHRWVASGTGNVISPLDFARARYSLTEANVPLKNLVAVVDPSVAFTLETQTNFVNFMSPMPSAERIVREGMETGFTFKYNLFGFDVYISNYLQQGLTDDIDSRQTTNGVANLFFSATPGDSCPIIGAFRQLPTVESEWNKDLQQWEFLTICEYGFKLYRPENMVVVISEKTNVWGM